MSKKKVSFRAGGRLVGFIDELSEEWDATQSEVIRILIRSYMGVLEGNFLSLLDDDSLDRWGEMGKLLRTLKYSERVSSKVDNAKLKDVLTDPDILISAGIYEVTQDGENN